MNRATGLRALGLATVIAGSGSPQAFAECPASQPAIMFDSYVVGCPDTAPVGNFLAVVGSASTINNNGISAICQDENGTDGFGDACNSVAGVLGDGQVYVQFDWDHGSPGGLAPLGCPNPYVLPNVGRNFIQIVCNDGASAIVTTSFDTLTSGYNFDFASRYDPGSGSAFLNLSRLWGLSWISSTSVGGNRVICVNQSSPIAVFSDCDADSAATQFGITCPDTTPTVDYGADLYTYTTTGSRPPADLRVSAWTLRPTTPGPAGSKCVTVPEPAGCPMWVGATAVIGGQDSGAIASWAKVCTPMAVTDVVKIDSAAFVQGKLDVAFSTENEALIVGFDVYAGSSTKLNTGLIPAKGSGSNTYSFEVGRGAARSNRTVTVEAVLSDATIVRTAPASVM